MKTKTPLFLSIFLASLLFSSCAKEEINPGPHADNGHTNGHDSGRRHAGADSLD